MSSLNYLLHSHSRPRAPVFTSGAKLDPQPIDVLEEHIESGSENTGDEDDDDNSDGDAESDAVEEEEELFAGISQSPPGIKDSNPSQFRGFGSSGTFAPKNNSVLADMTTGPGSVRSGIGSKSQFPEQTSVLQPQSVPLSASEKVHFQKLAGSFGARMLAGMGWQPVSFPLFGSADYFK